jgi:hypothetical protein
MDSVVYPLVSSYLARALVHPSSLRLLKPVPHSFVDAVDGCALIGIAMIYLYYHLDVITDGHCCILLLGLLHQ